jgi:hypothetical protein
MKLSTLLPLALLLAASFSCGTGNEDPGTNPEKIILDTDMGSDCDDVGALALLNEYAREGKAEILGVIFSSGAVPYGVGVIDAINHYYGHHNIPIGASYDTTFGDPVDKMQAEKLSRDTAAFKNRYILNTDVPEQTRLNRKILAGQADKSVTYLTIGHTKGLYDLLVSGPDSISGLSGFELASKKIRRWVALGAIGAENPEGHYTKEWNFFFNGAAPYTDYLIDHFPGDIFFIAAGTNVMTGKSLIQTPGGNIVRTAYRDWLWNCVRQTMAGQRPSWDLVGVYFAVIGPGDYLEILDKGYLDFKPEEGCRWIRSDTATLQRFVIQKDKMEDDFADYLNGMISKHSRKD